MSTGVRWRWLVLAALCTVGGLALIPAALAIKNNEYYVAHWLAKRDLPAMDQAATMAGILRASRFALAARSPDGRVGALLLDRDTAQHYGLRIDPSLVGRTHRRPLRLLGLVASDSLEARDERFDIDRHLTVALRILDERRQALLAQLKPLGPAAGDPEFAAVLAMVSIDDGLDAIVTALDTGELGRMARAETDPTREQDLFLAPPLLWRLTRDAEPADAIEADFLRQVRRTWISTRVYRQVLPQIQARNHPTLFEYINAYKGVLVELTALPKWLLHFLLGGLAYAVAVSTLRALGMGVQRRTAWALAFAVTLALGVEVADATDIRQTGKQFDAVGSAADAVVTALLPSAAWWWQRRRSRRP